MDNPAYATGSENHEFGSISNAGQRNGEKVYREEVSLDRMHQPQDDGKIRTFRENTKEKLQSNSCTAPFCPPKGEAANSLTLILTLVSIFITARTVLGPVADIGGTIFALLVLITLALIGGKLVLGLCWFLTKITKGAVDIKLPPLLGMLIVGILLKNVPYNWGQFGRGEHCIIEGSNVSHRAIIDSIHDLDPEQKDDSLDHFRRRRSALDNEEFLYEDNDWFEIDHEDALKNRVVRSVSGSNEEHASNKNDSDDCEHKYIGHDMDPQISRTLRLICLTVILLMAGLELDPVALMKLSSMVVRATFIPCFVEALVVAVLSKLLLGFPWTVGLMLGFVLAAVSPAVIIPCLMSLSQRGYGVEKGIPTLVIAACSADDVVAISGFGIFLGITFNTGKPLWTLILHGPIEVLIGVAFGLFWGLLAQWIPNKDHRHVAFFRWLILLGGGLIALFGAHLIHYDGAGGLATIIMAFVAGMEWRREGWGDHNPVTKTFHRMWLILEPVIFALIGTEIQIHKINLQTLGYSVTVLVIALLIRMVATYGAVSGGNLNRKEKVFMAFAWMPKATVQAALGPIFLDNVGKIPDHLWDTPENKDAWIFANPGKNETEWNPLGDKAEWTGWGEDILTLAVMSILITAPLGAVLILAFGVKFLEPDEGHRTNFERNIQTEYPIYPTTNILPA